jgi:hypothetical protein
MVEMVTPVIAFRGWRQKREERLDRRIKSMQSMK